MKTDQNGSYNKITLIAKLKQHTISSKTSLRNIGEYILTHVYVVSLRFLADMIKYDTIETQDWKWE